MASALPFITPTIKFRVHPKQIDEKFEKSPAVLLNTVRYTKNDISPSNIGLLGTMNNWGFPPLFSAPVKVFKGTCLLVGAGAVGYGAIKLFPNFVTAHKVAIVAGAIFAIV